MNGGRKPTTWRALPWAVLSSALLAGCAKPPPASEIEQSGLFRQSNLQPKSLFASEA